MAKNEAEGPREELRRMTKTLLAVSTPAAHFSSADRELLQSGKYADAKIIANGKTYDVHKNVLCTRSKFFRKVFEGAFRVSAPLQKLPLTLRLCHLLNNTLLPFYTPFSTHPSSLILPPPLLLPPLSFPPFLLIRYSFY